MSKDASATIVRLEGAQAAIRDAFLGWQCRLRQLSARNAEGRPTGGMRPRLLIGDTTDLGPVTVLIVPQDPADAVLEISHMVRRTHDPAERYKSALRLFAAHYYQQPRDFSDRMTALFGGSSQTARAALSGGGCTLAFEQYNQRYVLPCLVSELAANRPEFQLTLWHNSLFNPRIPPDIRILEFAPDWARAEADPPVP